MRAEGAPRPNHDEFPSPSPSSSIAGVQVVKGNKHGDAGLDDEEADGASDDDEDDILSGQQRAPVCSILTNDVCWWGAR